MSRDTTSVATSERPCRKAKTTQKRVYGKSKANAPRAVLDGSSPLKSRNNAMEQHAARRQSPRRELIMDRVEIRVAKMTLEDTASSYCESFPTTPVQTLAAKIDDLSLQEETPKKTQVTPQRTSETENISLQKETSAAAQVTPQKTTTPQQVKEVSPASSKPFTPRRLSSAAPGTPNAKRTRPKKLPIQSPDDYVQDEKVNAYVRPILNEAVSSLAAQSVQKFSAWAARSESAFDVVKIAEGSYGEVFKLRLRDDAEPRRAKLRAYGEGVFKVVPLRAQQGAGSKRFTRIDEIVAEVKLLKLMDPIPGFARFREVHVVQGRFPESFQRAWIVYKQTKDDCMNPNPANKRAYADNQLWAILEMDDAGIELEKFRWSNMFQVYDIFWGVAMALARAEELALFEHRDLHLGNICLRSTRPDGAFDAIDATRLDSPSGFGISGLETTIIDYSLSRAELRFGDEGTPVECSEIASSDLDSKQLFDAVGRDEDEILLRDTYRYMRNALYTGNALTAPAQGQTEPGIWREYAPKTNLIWLLFILKNLLKNIHRPAETSAARSPLKPCSDKKINAQSPSPTKATRQSDGKLQQASAQLIKQVGSTLEGRLRQVLELLDLEHGRDDMCCAADLVAFAIDQGWLSEGDFFQS
ncbi:hypothetical protein VTN31DRAFT_2242 [Thermomyces dupontii]|uniref:uncharacterized protein n=1 Tax=Talaromyces thermophilus TaxID=28565 RepID=UPI0037422B03